MKNTLTIMTAAAMVFTIADQAQARPAESCTIQSAELISPSDADYNPFQHTDEVLTLRFRVEMPESCRLGLGLDGGNASNLLGPADDLRVRFKDSRGQVASRNGAPLPSIRSVYRNGAHVAELRVELPAGQNVRPGLYENTFSLLLFQNGRPAETVNFNITASVASRADIRLIGNADGGAGSAAGLDFGVLKEGKMKLALMSVRSNANYALQVSSENSGALRNYDFQGPDSRIDYDAWLDGEMMTLSGGGDSKQYSPSRLNQNINKLRIRIGKTEGKAAGTYRDMLHVSVIMLE